MREQKAVLERVFEVLGVTLDGRQVALAPLGSHFGGGHLGLHFGSETVRIRLIIELDVVTSLILFAHGATRVVADCCAFVFFII